MSDWRDLIFGNLPPPQPARPTSTGALLGMGGYQNMPTSPNIDDRTVPGANVFPSRPHDQLRRMQVNPFGQTYNSNQWDYLQSHLPGGQPPTTFLPDPDRIVDPSIVAHIKAADALANQRTDYNDPDLPTPYQPPPPNSQRSPQFSSPQPNGFSSPMGAASQPSYQQLVNFLQSGGMS